MGDPYKKVSRGQPFQPSATTQNFLIEMAQRVKRGASEDSGPLIFKRDYACIRVKNVSGENVPRFGVLSIVSFFVDEATNSRTFFNSPVLYGFFPYIGFPVCIAQEPIADGEIGLCMISGVTHVKVDVMDETDTHAVPIYYDGVTTEVSRMRSANHGPCEILAKDSGTGEVNAIVRIGMSASSVFVKLVSSMEDPEGTLDACIGGYNGKILVGKPDGSEIVNGLDMSTQVSETGAVDCTVINLWESGRLTRLGGLLPTADETRNGEYNCYHWGWLYLNDYSYGKPLVVIDQQPPPLWIEATQNWVRDTELPEFDYIRGILRFDGSGASDGPEIEAYIPASHLGDPNVLDGDIVPIVFDRDADKFLVVNPTYDGHIGASVRIWYPNGIDVGKQIPDGWEELAVSKGRVPVGFDGSNALMDEMGETFGEAEHQHETQSDPGGGFGTGGIATEPADNYQPSWVVKYIIRIDNSTNPEE